MECKVTKHNLTRIIAVAGGGRSGFRDTERERERGESDSSGGGDVIIRLITGNVATVTFESYIFGN